MTEPRITVEVVYARPGEQALERLIAGRTTIVIAHRLSTIRSADTIVVLEGRRIKETGSHAELLAHDGLYKQLYTVQQRIDETGARGPLAGADEAGMRDPFHVLQIPHDSDLLEELKHIVYHALLGIVQAVWHRQREHRHRA